MRFDVSNFEGLRNACEVFRGSDRDEPLILIFQTPGRVLHRFIVTDFGIEKQDCTQSGGEL